MPRLCLAELGIPADAHLALAVGRLDPQKGVVDLLAAAERVIPHSAAWHLALAGDGPCRKWLLNQLTTSPQLGGRVHWLGIRNDVPGLLKAANVLVLASLWEGMPNVILEAMAAGRPVIATAVEGSEELVQPGQTGWLVPPGDPESLSMALLDAAGDPHRCWRFGLNGRIKVQQEYSIDQTVTSYERLWSALLGYKLALTDK